MSCLSYSQEIFVSISVAFSYIEITDRDVEMSENTEKQHHNMC